MPGRTLLKLNAARRNPRRMPEMLDYDLVMMIAKHIFGVGGALRQNGLMLAANATAPVDSVERSARHHGAATGPSAFYFRESITVGAIFRAKYSLLNLTSTPNYLGSAF